MLTVTIRVKKMVSYSDEQIKQLILERISMENASILAPVVRSRKGHYRII